MLKARVITALALLALLLPSLFFLPQAGWALLMAAVVGVAAWEWGALLGWQSSARRGLGVGFAVFCAVVALFDPAALGVGQFTPAMNWVWLAYGASAVLWGVVVPLWLRRKWRVTGVPGLLVGAVLLFPTWLAMVQLRALGPGVLLAVLAVVWMADIAAYFSGRAFGRRKLAPNISPGKTWEGAFGAVLGVLAYGFAVPALAGVELLPAWLWAPLLLLTTVVSIIGDLFESMLKRQAGIKDSSNILPGHGGVLDRVDSLTSTLPFAALLWLLFVGVAG
ncbi:phosphatidate cytidylyltransferase [Dechloromonas sp. ZY10]|uniref:phosphatidate cytidylyltransferase n=1 Tax=Dechloromonas aquae TaxID=2664436 RepID=UPI003528D08E